MTTRPRMLTTDTVASRLNVSRRTIQTLCVEGKIGAIRVGHQWRISEEALQAFIRRGGSEPDHVAVEPSEAPNVVFRRK